MADHSDIDHTGLPGAGAPADILDLPTAETDDALVLAPDGAGGVEFRAEAGGGGGLASGSSFPGTPSTNDLFYHTTHAMLFYYDGTRWLSTQVHHIELKSEDVGNTWPLASTTGVVHRATLPFGTDFDYWLIAWETLSQVLTTNNGTNYWTANLRKFPAPSGASTVIADITTIADGTDVVVKKDAIGALMGSNVAFFTEATKVLSPGTWRFHGGNITCRVVGT